MIYNLKNKLKYMKNLKLLKKNLKFKVLKKKDKEN